MEFATTSIKHRYINIDGMRIFYREAGPDDAHIVVAAWIPFFLVPVP